MSAAEYSPDSCICRASLIISSVITEGLPGPWRRLTVARRLTALSLLPANGIGGAGGGGNRTSRGTEAHHGN